MKLGVIGWPVAHSKSPAMQTAALQALGLEGEYVAQAVAPDELALFVEHAAAHGFRGVNVTIPHKEAALKLCAPDELAARVGAVNTLLFEGGATKGYNTDVYGFEQLAKEAGAPLDGGVIVLLGAGGAARAVAHAVHGLGKIAIVARTPRSFVVDGVAMTVTPWSDDLLAKLLARADVLVDATPRGLDAAAPTIDLSPLPAHAVVLDLVVARDTALTSAAKARGLKAAAGASMLVHQGARALELWTGKSAPVDVMRKALDAQL
ncbi:MAG: shikimate dehydrogenase family protein [Polyangia bacterium]